MFGFVKQIFISVMMFFGCNLPSVNSLSKFISMNNQECKVRPQIVNVNSEETVLFPFSIKTNKCNGNNMVIISMIHKQSCVFLMMLKI